MSDINGPKFRVNNNLNFNSVQKQTPEVPAGSLEYEEPKITDFGDPKAEALGRSMLIKDADNINSDLKALIDNPQVAENSDKIFETVYNAAKDAGVENSYEEAASFSTGVIK